LLWGSVLEESLTIQIATVSIVALLATVGVYGIVALIVRIDDAGYRLIKHSKEKGFLAVVGNILVKALPVIIKILAVVGTLALILVSGGIFEHNIDYLHHSLPTWNPTLKDFIIGLIAGLITAAIVTIGKAIFKAIKRK
jgi:predicted DNA repair protein MutK